MSKSCSSTNRPATPLGDLCLSPKACRSSCGSAGTAARSPGGGGSRPVRSGKVVLFDVKSGRRLAEIGDELDSVLAADLSPDQRGWLWEGRARFVKVYSTGDGRLAYSIAKHTDWITALQFSPDGSKLATATAPGPSTSGSRARGESSSACPSTRTPSGPWTGGGDGQALATGGEDGKLILWDAQGGWPSVTLDSPHTPKASAKGRGKKPGGVLSAQFTKDGRLLTCGRDRTVRFWDASGKPLASYQTPSSLPAQGGRRLRRPVSPRGRFRRQSPLLGVPRPQALNRSRPGDDPPPNRVDTDSPMPEAQSTRGFLGAASRRASMVRRSRRGRG